MVLSSLPPEPENTALLSFMELLERAWKSWTPGQRLPIWCDFLPGTGQSCNPEEVFHLVQLDIEYRVKTGNPGLIAVQYFLHPRLDQADAHLDQGQQIDLVRWEYQQRWKKGDRPRREEYQRAFPRLALELDNLAPRWNCPSCRHTSNAVDGESASTWKCPRCARSFSPDEIYPPAKPSPPKIPETIASALDPREYVLLEPLGAGGMGEVYRGRDPGLSRDLAVKVMRPALCGHPEAEARFLREAQITGALQHPGIVPIHNVGRFPDGRLYFTMKLVRGQTLENMLPQSASELSESLLGIFAKICQAVAYAHSKRVIHRDLKPANVMIGRFGEVQVMDWGLAKVLPSLQKQDTGARDPDGVNLEPVSGDGDTVLFGTNEGQTVIELENAPDLSRAGRALGTPAFMPPEQAIGELEKVDERADVFSLGAILCVLLTGKPPYMSSDWNDVLRMARQGNLKEAQNRLDSCGADAELIRLCKDCLSAEPQARPDHAGIVADRLEVYQNGVRDRLRQAELERAQAQIKEQERRKRRRLSVALSVMAAVILIGGAGVLWWRQHQVAQTDQAVTQSLAEARLLRQQAQITPSDLVRFREAVTAARKADDLARTGGASTYLSLQTGLLLGELEQEVQDAGKDRELATALLEVRRPREGPKYEMGPGGRMTARIEPSADEQFAQAFRNWGLDIDRVSTAEAVEKLRTRPTEVLTQVAAALDEWAGERRRQENPSPQAIRRLTDLATALEKPGKERSGLRVILNRERLPMERAVTALLAAFRPVPVPIMLPFGDSERLQSLLNKANPKTDPTLGILTLVRALRLSGDEVGAEKLLRATMQAKPQEVVVYQTLGRMLAEQKPPRWAEAVECYRTARALRPELGASLAEALVLSGKRSEGLELFDRLVEEKPDNPFVQYRRGQVLVNVGLAKAALGAYERALELDPNDSMLYVGLAGARDRLQDLDGAVGALNKAIEISPKLALAHANLGNIYLRKKDHESSIRHCNKAIELDPKLGLAYHNLGTTLHDKGDLEQAIGYYRKAIELDSTLFRAYYNLARGMHLRRNYPAAMRLYKIVIEMAPRFPGPYYYLGEAQRETGDLEGALRTHRKVVEINRQNPWAHFFLGNTLQATGDFDGAIRCFRTVVELDPEGPDGHLRLSQILLEVGRFRQAEEAARRGYGLVPPDDPQKKQAEQMIQDCQGFLGADEKLTAYLGNPTLSVEVGVRLQMARLAQANYKQLFAASARLYKEVFQANPSLAEDLVAGHRYNAACAAALAGCGKGKDAAQLDEKGRFSRRTDALQWLRADLALRQKQLKTPAGRQARRTLLHWRQDPDLSGIRDAAELEKVSPAEQKMWKQFWAEVEALLRKK